MAVLQNTTGNDWKGLADDYLKITAKTSSRPIGMMLSRADALLSFSEATGILDNGCGPGPVMSRLLKDYEIPKSCTLMCSDFSEAMIAQVKKSKEEATKSNPESPWNRVETVVQNAMDMESVPDASISHVTAGWVYFMVPEPQKALSESLRVLKDGGVLTCSSWEGSSWMDLMALLPRIRPDKIMPKMPKEWENVDLMGEELRKASFRDVESHRVPTSMKYESLEGLADFMATKMPHMVKLMADFTEDERAQYKRLMVEEGRKICPHDPGELPGVSLVSVGRK